MTNETKTLIISLRESGKSYGEIVLITGVCESTVKTICLRYKKQNKDKNKCKYCSKELKFIKGKKKKIFCSDNCRMLYWKENRKLIKRKPCFDLECPICHCHFMAYKSQCSKYCSWECYLTSRKKVHAGE